MQQNTHLEFFVACKRTFEDKIFHIEHASTTLSLLNLEGLSDIFKDSPDIVLQILIVQYLIGEATSL